MDEVDGYTRITTYIHGYIPGTQRNGCLQPYRQRVRPASELISLVLGRVDVDVHRYGANESISEGKSERERERKRNREREGERKRKRRDEESE